MGRPKKIDATPTDTEVVAIEELSIERQVETIQDEMNRIATDENQVNRFYQLKATRNKLLKQLSEQTQA
jgi:predicted metal-dependent phosphoesterase TrpH